MKNKSCDITGRSGFTLIELMVTIGVLAIMAAVAIPGFSRWLPSYHLKSAARAAGKAGGGQTKHGLRGYHRH
jgi:prepilin-type N-terminal cleavage/methylation domain-containing protein